MSSRVKVVIDEPVVRRVVRQAVKRGADAGGFAAANILIDELTPPPERTGEVYTRGSVVHQASAPGESPARDTGELVQSIFSDTEVFGLRAVATVGSPLEKAAYLHFGTEDIEPRPYFNVLFEAPALQDIRQAVLAGIRGVG